MKIATLLPLAILVTSCAHQPPAEPPKLYAMFQKYCVATDGQFAAVDRAATADGFVNHQGQGVLANLFHIESVTWQKGKDIISIGPLHRMVKGADGTLIPASYEPPGARAEACSITIATAKDDSQEAIARWAGVPVQHNPKAAEIGDELSDRYGFRIENGKHVATGNYWDRSADAAVAGSWSILFYKRGAEYGVSLQHIYMPAATAAP